MCFAANATKVKQLQYTRANIECQMTKLVKIKTLFKNNTKVVENYFFMTALQIISSAFGILIYPYLIRVMGADSYGLYVYAISVTTYFLSFIAFGFNFVGLKLISQNKVNVEVKSNVVSAIISAKTYLAVLSCIAFAVIVMSIPFLRDHKIIFTITFVQILSEIIFPVWYFQGIQKMKIVTYTQLFFRILSVPFIILMIRSAEDCWKYAMIASLTVVLPAISMFIYLIRNEKLNIRLISPGKLKTYFKDALPFFWSSTAGTIKQESVTIIIGAFFGMKDVALYDLANKLIILPRMLTSSINAALFPKVIENIKNETVRKLIKYETLIGLAVIAFVVVFGYWLIWLLGGTEMLGAYPLAVILSFTVTSWLVVGSYINFVFVPQNKYYFVTQNQLVALLSFMILCIPFTLIYKNIWVVTLALTFSGFCEILYCRYIVKKHSML